LNTFTVCNMSGQEWTMWQQNQHPRQVWKVGGLHQDRSLLELRGSG
jgi:hypothetical protein